MHLPDEYMQVEYTKHAITGELGYDRLNGTRKIGPSYAKYDEYLICNKLGPSISSVICKNLSYSGPSYPSSPVFLTFPMLRLLSSKAQKHNEYECVAIHGDL